ncbi:hypothetical protein ACFU8W_43470 [Streptomyces sp. NPDC057565]|uniref:hypothetical protein n=1 Tax=Streptomyces sp. NPDC057565 TaxID=3346169 RepID=UPI003678515F
MRGASFRARRYWARFERHSNNGRGEDDVLPTLAAAWIAHQRSVNAQKTYGRGFRIFEEFAREYGVHPMAVTFPLADTFRLHLETAPTWQRVKGEARGEMARTGMPYSDASRANALSSASSFFAYMELAFYSSEGWESWGLSGKPTTPEGMAFLIDDDLLFEDGRGGVRATAVANEWLRLRPTENCPALSSWGTYARILRDWIVAAQLNGVEVFDTRGRLKALLSTYAVAEEFVRRLKALQEAGTLPDPRDAQVARLKAESNTLRNRLARQSATIEELTSFKTLALSRIAAQHEEITRVRSSQPNPDTPPVVWLTPVPGRSHTIGSCS